MVGAGEGLGWGEAEVSRVELQPQGRLSSAKQDINNKLPFFLDLPLSDLYRHFQRAGHRTLIKNATYSATNTCDPHWQLPHSAPLTTRGGRSNIHVRFDVPYALFAAMSPYGKVAQAAIASMSLLAEHYASSGGRRWNSREIAAQRKLSQAIVGKVLTTLSQMGLVHGAPGPGGGYALARPPEQITLHDVVAPFDRLESTLICPFGEGWCGHGPQCPLHEQLDRIRQQITTFLQQTTLARFQQP